jgi:hypothetical protein
MYGTLDGTNLIEIQYAFYVFMQEVDKFNKVVPTEEPVTIKIVSAM